MDGIITLPPSERKTLWEHDRKSTDPALRFCSPILLRLADGQPWSQITRMLYTSPSTMNLWKDRLQRLNRSAIQGSVFHPYHPALEGPLSGAGLEGV